MPDPKQMLAYTTSLGAELGLLAEYGQRQFITGESVVGNAAFIVATGTEEAAMLSKWIAKMDADPEFQEWQAKRKPRAEAEIVGAMTPENN